jgi:hypothetical protein
MGETVQDIRVRTSSHFMDTLDDLFARIKKFAPEHTARATSGQSMANSDPTFTIREIGSGMFKYRNLLEMEHPDPEAFLRAYTSDNDFHCKLFSDAVDMWERADIETRQFVIDNIRRLWVSAREWHSTCLKRPGPKPCDCIVKYGNNTDMYGR